jgi:hypothetical protein
MTCTCHPKLHRRLRSGGPWFQVSTGQKPLEDLTSTEKKLDVVACTCHPSSCEKHKKNRRNVVHKIETLFQNDQNKKAWSYGLSGRVPA